MAIDLKSRIILAKNIKMDRNYNNVLSYTEDEMLSLCQTNKVVEADNYSFIRTNQTILCGFNYEMCLQANYIAFQNPDYSNKWFFAWIDEVNYKGDNNTEIVYTIDSWSTWYDYWKPQTCFVAREHVNDDTIGVNTVDEGLNVGSYILAENPTKILDKISDYIICMAVSELPDESVPEVSSSRIYNGIYGGLIYIAFPTADDCNKAIKMYDSQAKADAISYLFMIPKNLSSVLDGQQVQWTVGTVGTANVIYISTSSNSDNIVNLIGNMPTHVGKSYIPKNNKLYTFPYNFANVTNNNGITENYRYEDFIIDTSTGEKNFSFWLSATLCPGMSMILIPLQYKNLNFNYEYAIQGAKLPICSWNSDVYINWLTNQSINIGSSMLNTITNSIENPTNIVGNIANQINSLYQANLIPNQARGNTNSGDVNFSEGLCGFTIYYETIKDEYAKIIDDYFTRFGYKINRVKVPNITGRQNFNFIEIGSEDVIGYGTVPAVYMDNINNACRKGVTIWHSHSNLGNFNVSNNIV